MWVCGEVGHRKLPNVTWPEITSKDQSVTFLNDKKFLKYLKTKQKNIAAESLRSSFAFLQQFLTGLPTSPMAHQKRELALKSARGLRVGY